MRVAALLLLAAGFAATLLLPPWGDDHVTDLPLYAAFADAFLAGSLPYRDLPFEYPPLAALLLAAPGLAGDYALAFGVLAVVLAAFTALLAGALAERTGGERRRAVLAAAALPLLLGAIVRTRFDLAPVVLTFAALALLCTARPRAGMAVLGLGAATKLFPLVVAPVALAWLLGRGERRGAAAGAAALATVLLATFGIAAAMSPSGLGDSFGYHLERPVQVESSPAMVLNALDAIGAGEASSVHSHGSDGLVHPASGMVSGAFTIVLLAVLGLIVAAVTSRRAGPADARVLVLGSLAAVAALAALGRVLSPQFLIWVVPLGALGLAWRMRALVAAVALAALLTLLEFPGLYEEVVAREPAALAVVAMRDLALLGVVALAGRELARGAMLSRARGQARASALSPWRGRRRPPRPAPR